MHASGQSAVTAASQLHSIQKLSSTLQFSFHRLISNRYSTICQCIKYLHSLLNSLTASNIINILILISIPGLFNRTVFYILPYFSWTNDGFAQHSDLHCSTYFQSTSILCSQHSNYRSYFRYLPHSLISILTLPSLVFNNPTPASNIHKLVHFNTVVISQKCSCSSLWGIVRLPGSWVTRSHD